MSRSAEYEAYIVSPAWQQKRKRALWRAGFRCQVCNTTERLDVHHRTYERFGREEDGDLTVLCRTCHDLYHHYKNAPPAAPAVPITKAPTPSKRTGKVPRDEMLAAFIAFLQQKAGGNGKQLIAQLARRMVAHPSWPPTTIKARLVLKEFDIESGHYRKNYNAILSSIKAIRRKLREERRNP